MMKHADWAKLKEGDILDVKGEGVLCTNYWDNGQLTAEIIHGTIAICFGDKKYRDYEDDVWCFWVLGDVEEPRSNSVRDFTKLGTVSDPVKALNEIWRREVCNDMGD